MEVTSLGLQVRVRVRVRVRVKCYRVRGKCYRLGIAGRRLKVKLLLKA